MALLDGLLEQVKNAVTQHGQNGSGFDPGQLVGQITQLFNKHPHNQPGNPLPASQDPYGDPADQGGAQRNVKPASQDPYGDPGERR